MYGECEDEYAYIEFPEEDADAGTCGHECDGCKACEVQDTDWG